MSLRKIPLEVIQCRHCDKSLQTSEKQLCSALLCQDCFDIRKVNRKGYPKLVHEKAEHNMGDRYGENRVSKKVVCAACGQLYLVYKRLTDRFSRESYLYTNAPLDGWTNDILCESCFDNVQIGCEDEIKRMNENESERIKEEAIHKANAEVQRRKTEYEDAVNDKSTTKLLLIILSIFLISTIFSLLRQCSEPTTSYVPSSDVYYRK